LERPGSGQISLESIRQPLLQLKAQASWINLVQPKDQPWNFGDGTLVYPLAFLSNKVSPIFPNDMY
jgi:hypothetical protein